MNGLSIRRFLLIVGIIFPWSLQAQLIVAGEKHNSVIILRGGMTETRAKPKKIRQSRIATPAVSSNHAIHHFTEIFKKYARLNHVPMKALQSIALVESNGNPFAIYDNNSQESHHFDSKEEAIQYAKRRIDRGFNNLDLGLMQVNWRYHNKKLGSVEEAFNVEKNIQVASEILSEALSRHDNLIDAVASYHSGIDARRKIYLVRFIEQWYRSDVQFAKN